MAPRRMTAIRVSAVAFSMALVGLFIYVRSTGTLPGRHAPIPVQAPLADLQGNETASSPLETEVVDEVSDRDVFMFSTKSGPLLDPETLRQIEVMPSSKWGGSISPHELKLLPLTLSPTDEQPKQSPSSTEPEP